MWPVDPLQRTCTELLPNEDDGAARSSQEPAPVITVRELAEVPVFVLLGEPGMGKSETMKALATLVLGEQGTPIAANDFIVLPASPHNAEHPVFIDALDEARASGDNGVWRALRTRIAEARLLRFGIACRVADWLTTDAQDIRAVVPGRSVRVFSLDPLSPEQARAVLAHEQVPDIDGFEEQAQRLGFGDMLRNPQSLKLLAAAVRGNANHWPQTRHEAYEMACQQLVGETNPHHKQTRVWGPPQGHDTLLYAAGWLCSLQLLSNASDIAEDTLTNQPEASVRLTDVLDSLPRTDFSETSVQQVLRRRVFAKPHGYAASHRTVAEFLAGRYLAHRITNAGLSPGRLSALMLASPQHLISNLRGLAGWLATLSEPMRAAVFQADPAAVLDYGDLYLLPQPAKQTLIEQLSAHPRTSNLSNVWQKSVLYVPLVQPDMSGFVTAWFSTYRSERPTSSSQTTVAYVLLNALHHVPVDERWVAPFLGLIRDESVYIGVRVQALDALVVHSSPAETLELLDRLQHGTRPDEEGRLTGRLLQHLYPKHIPPSQVLRFMNLRTSGRQVTELRMFWTYDIARLTTPNLLPELMDAVERASTDGLFAEPPARVTGHRLEGLAKSAVDAIERYGTTIPIERLANWIKLCTDHKTSPFKHLEPQLAQRLDQWTAVQPERVEAVLAHWVRHGDKSWTAQNRIPSARRMVGLGQFWLKQAKAWDFTNDAAKAKDCLETAFWWVAQEGGGVSLNEFEEAAALSSTLQQALEPLLSSPLGEENWQRENWLQDQTYRKEQLANGDLNEQNRRYLLDHLEEIRNGKLLTYLSAAAWRDLRDDGYDGGDDAELIGQWREAYPELDSATREGYQAVLGQLTAVQANAAVRARKNGEILHIDLPCLLAAHHLFSEQTDRFFNLGEERLKALVTLHLLNHSAQHDWFLALVERYPSWVEDAWWDLCKRQLRSKKELRIPQMGLLRYELAASPLAVRLLSQALAAWPVKFAERNFSEFAELLEAVLRQCPAPELSRLIQTRLQRKSLGSLQTAYLLMAGLWVDHLEFTPKVQKGLISKQLVQTELLGFLGHLRRYGSESKSLPAWDAGTLDLLFRLFAPLCSPVHPVGTYSPGIKDAGRDFLYQLLASFRNDTSEAAQKVLAALLTEPSLSEWRSQLEETASRQAQARAEKSFVVPTPRQVALTLHNKAPANPSDLMAVALDALGDLQREIRNNPSNLINNFWTVDKNGKVPQPPHRPENTCRDVIAQWLSPRLSAMSVTVLPELQHGDQKRSDLGLLVHNVGAPEMLLPIEVKGDWHEALWTAAHLQLGQQYASDNRCLNQGIYLVLWMGDLQKLQQAHNLKVKTAAELQRALQQQEDQRGGPVRIRVIVLDLSIPNR
ncbi:ATP-binding protein [Hydrogenophaga sp. A37]|uniref:ATP-binding protein n=1 Tax=Hydrogenophaga sp. A37 TaxID=1945864 RepID=UPI000985F6D5|nr:ATP-binding protein [Hydrogenophaga sp. A37]OOG83791.1 hypothetical protein B0E41_12040 [Hydrogenophaga sp. A37]